MSFKVAVITGYLKDPEFAKLLLQSLNHQSWKEFDCYVYASPTTEYYIDDHFLSALDYKCYQLKLSANEGFAGNNNYAIKEAYKTGDYKYMVLVNDDTVADKNWLKKLVETSESTGSTAAVASKMVFYQPFITLKGKTQTAKSGDKRLLGIRLYDNSRFATTFYNKRFYTNGFYHAEEDEIYSYRWTQGKFEIEFPVMYCDDDYKLTLFIRNNKRINKQTLELSIGDTIITTIPLEKDKLCYEVVIAKSLVEKNRHLIIQNAGSGIKPGYNGYDIGAGEIDLGQYQSEREIDMFCGGSFLVPTMALVKTGLFMKGLFCYYEDSDLSLRLKEQGYKIIYNPQSLIYHYHTGSSKEWSPFFTYHAFRNKIIFSAKHFGFKAFAFAFSERAKEAYLFFKLGAKSRFRNPQYNARLKLNLIILKDALIGILKFKPAYINEDMHL